MFLCPKCICQGYCEKLQVRLVSDRKLDNPEYLRDLREFTASLGISPDHWREWLIDAYRDFRGQIVENGTEVFLDTDELETPWIREWFRDFANKPVEGGVRPRLKRGVRNRVRVFATILSTKYPFEMSMLGLRPANDNRPPVDQEAD